MLRAKFRLVVDQLSGEDPLVMPFYTTQADRTVSVSQVPAVRLADGTLFSINGIQI